MAESEEERHLNLAGEFDCVPEPLPTLRHSTSHVMAQAVKRIFPEVKVAIGPAIDDGFYYDFLKAEPFTPDDLARIEAAMRQIVEADHTFTREEMPREAAIRFFEERDEPFKVEILKGIDAPTVSLYRQGDFVDLCRGPHVASTGAIKAFKLLSSSGAYWRGDERNPMLQRIYGTAWLTQEDLDKHLWRLEEAKKRDHRKLGRELDLFVFHDVAPGAPFWLPNGMVIFRQLEAFWREVHDAHGYLETSTPILVNKKLWEQSGHWELYSDNMFKLDVEEQTFSLKPMNCPESTYIYRHALRSYRDLPLRDRGDRPPAPQRALGHADRPVPRAADHDGRRAHLLPSGPGAGRDHRRARTGARVLQAVRARARRSSWRRGRQTTWGRSSSGTRQSARSTRRSRPTGWRTS